MAAHAVLPEEDALPGAEAEATVCERNHFGRAGERHLNVARHVVGTLIGVGEVGVVFRHEAIDKAFEIAPRRRIGVFHNDEATAGVAAKDGDGAFAQSRFEQSFFHHVGKLGGGFTRRGDNDLFGKNRHGWENESGKVGRWKGENTINPLP